MSLPLTDDNGVVQSIANGVPVYWNAGLGYDANGLLCVTSQTSPDDTYQGGKRISPQGLLVVSESFPTGQPFNYNAGWPFDKVTGAVITQTGVPAGTDPRIAGVAVGPLGGVYMTEGGYVWTPYELWPDGALSPGLWNGTRYLNTVFNDDAGTTPVAPPGTVADSSNPIGLILDRKGGLALGPELVTNGTFDTDTTGWVAASGGTLSVSSSRLLVTSGGGGYGGAGTVIPFTVGKAYKISFTYTQGSSNAASIRATINGGSASPTSCDFASTSGEKSCTLIASLTSTLHTFIVQLIDGGAAKNGVFDNISVREIPGIHLSQSTSAARGVASARKNELIGTAALATQNVTTTAIPYTISFAGAGTVTASGTHVGALINGQTFTPTAGTLTLTIAGSVTTAQLERGSAVTSYQRVGATAADYDASAGVTQVRFDGIDDSLASATFTAGTLTSSMDCLIAVRRDRTASVVAGLYNAVADATKWFGMAESGSGSGCVGSGAGTPTVWVDGVQLTGGTAVTRGTLNTALTAGAFHVLEFRGLDLSTWTDAKCGLYTGYALNGAVGEIQLFASGQDANRDKARAYMAEYFGVTLPAWTGRYSYVTPPIATIPAAGEIVHGDNLLNKLNFSKVDLDGLAYTGPVLNTGHSIVLGPQTYTLVAPPVDYGSYFTLSISPTTQLADGIYTALVY